MRYSTVFACLLFASTAGHSLPSDIGGLPGNGPSRAGATKAPQALHEGAIYHTVGSGGGALEFQVLVNGDLFVRETLTLPADAAGSTFELLAGDKANIERLYKLAERSSNRVRVKVLVDERVVRDVSWSEIAASSRELRQLPMNLRSSKGAVRSFPAEAGPQRGKPAKPGFLEKDYDPECLASCDEAYADCRSNECGARFDCPYCQSQYGACTSNCEICTEPRSVTERTESYVTDVYQYGSYCRRSPYDWHETNIYDQLYVTVTHYRIQRTVYCDNTYQDTVIDSWTSNFTCERPSPWSWDHGCSWPNGTAYNTCYY